MTWKKLHSLNDNHSVPLVQTAVWMEAGLLIECRGKPGQASVGFPPEEIPEPLTRIGCEGSQMICRHWNEGDVLALCLGSQIGLVTAGWNQEFARVCTFVGPAKPEKALCFSAEG